MAATVVVEGPSVGIGRWPRTCQRVALWPDTASTNTIVLCEHPEHGATLIEQQTSASGRAIPHSEPLT